MLGHANGKPDGAVGSSVLVGFNVVLGVSDGSRDKLLGIDESEITFAG